MRRPRHALVVLLVLGLLGFALPALALAAGGGSAGDQQYTDPFGGSGSATTTHRTTTSAPAPTTSSAPRDDRAGHDAGDADDRQPAPAESTADPTATAATEREFDGRHAALHGLRRWPGRAARRRPGARRRGAAHQVQTVVTRARARDGDRRARRRPARCPRSRVRDARRTDRARRQAATPAATPFGFVGMNVDGPLLDAGVNLDPVFGTMVSSGVQAVRTTFNWAAAQPVQDGPISFTQTDARRRRRRGARDERAAGDHLHAGAGMRLRTTRARSPTRSTCCPTPRMPSALVHRYGPAGQLLVRAPPHPQAPDPHVADLERAELQLLLAPAAGPPTYVKLLAAAHAAIQAGGPGRQGGPGRVPQPGLGLPGHASTRSRAPATTSRSWPRTPTPCSRPT